VTDLSSYKSIGLKCGCILCMCDTTVIFCSFVCDRSSFFFKEDITQCSNERNNDLTNTRQHNKYLLQYIGYMFHSVNRSSSGLQQNKSQVLFRYWDPSIFTVVNIRKI